MSFQASAALISNGNPLIGSAAQIEIKPEQQAVVPKKDMNFFERMVMLPKITKLPKCYDFPDRHQKGGADCGGEEARASTRRY